MSSNDDFALRFNRQEVVLIVMTMIWGGSFLATQQALAVSGPLFFVGFRFAVAALFALAVALPVIRGLTRQEVVAGTAIGAAMYLGYTFQTFGLQTISSSKSAFITALYVPIVPLLQWIFLRWPPRLMSWVGIALAFAGLLLLAGAEAGAISFGRGELLTLACAVAIAAEIILISYFARRVDSRRVTLVQLAVTSLLAFATMPVADESLPRFSWQLLAIVCVLGLVSTVIQLAMNWAQKSVSPTRATLIYASEPVWAGAIGRIAGERLPFLAIVGAALIVAGMVVSELKPRKLAPLPVEAD
jgi:drug/metabolite transporter (DMT)-like permease